MRNDLLRFYKVILSVNCTNNITILQANKNLNFYFHLIPTFIQMLYLSTNTHTQKSEKKVIIIFFYFRESYHELS